MLFRINRLALALILILVCPLICSGQTFRVKVVGISDGDTFTAINRDKLRLKFRIAGIDAPERRQPFSNVAKKALSEMIHGKRVIVDVIANDGWGRHIAKVRTQSIDDVGARMVEMGYAWSYTEFDTLYAPLEAVARKSKIGLWKEPDPTPPWEWRKQ
jgi:endonuclease YncB( thermonuclease family)